MYAVWSGPIDVQVSLTSAYGPPAHRARLGSIDTFQLAPESRLTATAAPYAAPAGRRSCCQAATRWVGSAGSTASDGSSGASTSWPAPPHDAIGLGTLIARGARSPGGDLRASGTFAEQPDASRAAATATATSARMCAAPAAGRPASPRGRGAAPPGQAGPSRRTGRPSPRPRARQAP